MCTPLQKERKKKLVQTRGELLGQVHTWVPPACSGLFSAFHFYLDDISLLYIKPWVLIHSMYNVRCLARWAKCFLELGLPQSPNAKLMPWGLSFFKWDWNLEEKCRIPECLWYKGDWGSAHLGRRVAPWRQELRRREPLQYISPQPFIPIAKISCCPCGAYWI